MAEYVYVGDHAETVYVDDKCIPIGRGESIELTDEQLVDSQNAHLQDSLIPVVEEEPAQAEETTSKASTKSTAKK